jgi:hypothetical protein
MEPTSMSAETPTTAEDLARLADLLGGGLNIAPVLERPDEAVGTHSTDMMPSPTSTDTSLVVKNPQSNTLTLLCGIWGGNLKIAPALECLDYRPAGISGRGVQRWWQSALGTLTASYYIKSGATEEDEFGKDPSTIFADHLEAAAWVQSVLEEAGLTSKFSGLTITVIGVANEEHWMQTNDALRPDWIRTQVPESYNKQVERPYEPEAAGSRDNHAGRDNAEGQENVDGKPDQRANELSTIVTRGSLRAQFKAWVGIRRRDGAVS